MLNPQHVRSVVTRTLAACAVAAALSAVAAPAFAEGCPAGEIAGPGQGQPKSDAPASGVTDNVLTSIDLAKEPAAIRGRLFRLRQLVVQPGGVVPWHSHHDRPAIIFIVSGEIVEYASSCKVPIVHKTGDVTAETHATAHWWRNESDQPAILLSADLFPTSGTHDRHMM